MVMLKMSAFLISGAIYIHPNILFHIFKIFILNRMLLGQLFFFFFELVLQNYEPKV